MFKKALSYVLIVISWAYFWESLGGAGDYRTVLYLAWIITSLLYIVLSITMPIINKRKIAEGKDPERIASPRFKPPSLAVIILICGVLATIYFLGLHVFVTIIFFVLVFLFSSSENKSVKTTTNSEVASYKPRGQKVFCSLCNKHLGWGDHVRRYCDECNSNDNYVVLTDLD